MSGDRSNVRYEHSWVPTASLVAYAKNSRTHSPEQVAQVVASIRKFGFTNPVLIDEAGTIIAGHGRVMAATEMGLADVPVIRLAGLSDAERRAYVIADNKLAENSGWDDALLKAELSELKLEDGFDLSVIGFAEDELQAMFEPVAPEGGPDPDAAPPLPEAPVSQPGDVWVMGAHRVVCGDSTAPATWHTLLGTERVDAVWTDPPYNVAYDSKLAGKIKNDSLADAEFRALLDNAFAALFGVMKPGASMYVAHADTEGLNFRGAFAGAGFKLSGCLVWKKDSLVLGRSDYQWIHEPILYGWKPGSAHRWFGGRKQTTVQEAGDASPFKQLDDGSWAVKVGDQVLVVAGDAKLVGAAPTSVILHEKPRRSAEHPTMKPVSLIEKMLKFSARSGDIVADAFGGSGSTLIAADRLGMVARLVELDPKFVDVIVKRWQEYSGRKAVHAVTGAEFAS